MNNLAKFLTTINVHLDQLLLDPNNPRFSELGEEPNIISEHRFNDDRVQENTFKKMKASTFNVSELKDTIKTIGYLPMDRLVVKKWLSPSGDVEKYIVIEGNRRVAALKWLIDLHEIGKETFGKEQLSNFTNIECLLLDRDAAPETASLVLPGLRHISGIKEWGAYQKAKAVHILRLSGLSPQEAALSIGLSTRAANQVYRCYLALEQMNKDEEFGEHADPRLYSYFEEALKRPMIKSWLGWQEGEGHFGNTENLHEFYSWFVSTEDNEGNLKLPEAKSIRDLVVFIEDSAALEIFRSPDGSLSRALAKFQIDHPKDWFPSITNATAAIKSLTPDNLRQLDENSLEALQTLDRALKQALSDRTALLELPQD